MKLYIWSVTTAVALVGGFFYWEYQKVKREVIRVHGASMWKSWR